MVSFIPFWKTTQNMEIKDDGIIINKNLPTYFFILDYQRKSILTRMIIGSIIMNTMLGERTNNPLTIVWGEDSIVKKESKGAHKCFVWYTKHTSDRAWILHYLSKGQFKTKCQMYSGGQNKTMSSITWMLTNGITYDVK